MARTAPYSTRKLPPRTPVESNSQDRSPTFEAEVKQPSQEEIAQLAYRYWLERDANEGSAEEDWLRAERDLCERTTSPS
jgi:hypothetical protein